MWPVSARFEKALRLSHDVSTVVDVYRDGVLLAEKIPVSGGRIEIDEGSKVRRTISLTVADPDLAPDDAEDLLAPFGTELHVRCGVRMTEGDVEEVPVGVFRISSVSRPGWFAGLQISGGDRSLAVQEARFLRPENTARNVLVVEEIARLIRGALPDVEVFDLTNSRAPTLSATWERERWDAIEDLADSIGAEVFFDSEGRAIIRTVPRLHADSVAVWEIDVDEDFGSLLDVGTGLSSEGVYNAVVAEGEAQENSPTISRIAYQTEGPLRWREGYQVPRFFASKFIRTREQASAVAEALLARSLLYAQEVTADALPHYALDAGDVVGITRPDGRRSLHVVSALTLPLGPGGMGVKTRTNAEAVVSDMEALP